MIVDYQAYSQGGQFIKHAMKSHECHPSMMWYTGHTCIHHDIVFQYKY